MKSYKILIACVSGMSTSMLVSRMRIAATYFDFPISITYVAESSIENEAVKNDIVILGPQLRTSKRRFTRSLAEYNIPVVSVPIKDFAEMDGEKILKFAIQNIDDYRKKKE